MKKVKHIHLALALAAVVATPALAQSARFDSKPGSKVRMEGTSNIHDWQVEGKLIGGFIEAGANFPSDPGQAVTPGKVEAKAEAFIPVRSMTSIEKDGKPYSTKMDDIMYEKLKAPPNSKIQYKLIDLTLKEAAKSKDAPYVFEANGELSLAGVTKKISMPVNVLPLGDKKLKISFTTNVKMTDFGIQPPAPALAGGLIKTGDDVKLIIDWMVAQKPAK